MNTTPTPLERHLLRLIESEGPISVARYMEEVLQHPEHGYYRRGLPLGAKGDFTTAPEMSQIFGELVGLWLADRWEALSRPDPVHLVELGPGRGTLIADALRAMAVVPELSAAIDLHLVESNITLRKLQAEKVTAHWHDSLSDVPEGPLLLIANEFFDALPIRQYVRTPDGWRERMVGLKDGRLAHTTGPAGEEAALIHKSLESIAEGAIVEVCPEGLAVMAAIARRIARFGGAALIIDYGYETSAPGDSLQAVRRHQPVDIFDRPGESDLTAHVNFEQLRAVAHACGAETAGPVNQGAFLEALGIRVRAAMLARRATARQRMDIHAAVRRLTAPDMMGELFKVLAVVPPAQGTAEPDGGRHG